MQATVVPSPGQDFHLHLKSGPQGFELAVLFKGISVVVELLFEPLIRLINTLAKAWNNFLRMLGGQPMENAA